MANNQNILIDVGDQNLQFQEFYGGSGTSNNYDIPSSQLESDAEVGAEAQLLGNASGDGSETRSITSFWTFEFYQQFFDVNTDDVIKRLKGSIVPRPGFNFLEHVIAGKPDLYGPFWICVTLVFSIAITGNLAQYLQAATAGYHWHYDFHVVSIAATAIFTYAWLVPLAVWVALKWMGAQQQLPMLELVCLYGYSLAVYVPISLLWMVQLWWLQWVFVIGGACLSGAVLLSAVWPSAKTLGSGKILLVIILCAHLLLAAGFMLYFYHAQPITTDSGIIKTVATDAVLPKAVPTVPLVHNVSSAFVQPSAIPKVPVVNASNH